MPYDRQSWAAVAGGRSPSQGSRGPQKQLQSPGKAPAVCIRVVRAWGLREVVGGSNPYVVLRWGALSQSSQAVFSSVSPYFNAVLTFSGPRKDEVLKAFVYSRNMSLSDELLGYAEVDVEDLLAGQSSFSLVDLLEKHDRHAGFIEMSAAIK